uniref:Uncharacterized protein n=1 Tax=Clytia hemisphaerica TaxID=252671 RepID=A0A7M5WYM3_9CNID
MLMINNNNHDSKNKVMEGCGDLMLMKNVENEGDDINVDTLSSGDEVDIESSFNFQLFREKNLPSTIPNSDGVPLQRYLTVRATSNDDSSSSRGSSPSLSSIKASSNVPRKDEDQLTKHNQMERQRRRQMSGMFVELRQLVIDEDTVEGDSSRDYLKDKTPKVIVLKKAKEIVLKEKKSSEDLALQASRLSLKVIENLVKLDLLHGTPKDVCCPNKQPIEKAIPIIENNCYEPKNISIVLSQICWKCRRLDVDILSSLFKAKNELREKNWRKFKSYKDKAVTKQTIASKSKPSQIIRSLSKDTAPKEVWEYNTYGEPIKKKVARNSGSTSFSERNICWYEQPKNVVIFNPDDVIKSTEGTAEYIPHNEEEGIKKRQDEKSTGTTVVKLPISNTRPVQLNQPIPVSAAQLFQLHKSPIEGVYKTIAKFKRPNGETQIIVNATNTPAQTQANNIVWFTPTTKESHVVSKPPEKTEACASPSTQDSFTSTAINEAHDSVCHLKIENVKSIALETSSKNPPSSEMNSSMSLETLSRNPPSSENISSMALETSSKSHLTSEMKISNDRTPSPDIVETSVKSLISGRPDLTNGPSVIVATKDKTTVNTELLPLVTSDRINIGSKSQAVTTTCIHGNVTSAHVTSSLVTSTHVTSTFNSIGTSDNDHSSIPNLLAFVTKNSIPLHPLNATKLHGEQLGIQNEAITKHSLPETPETSYQAPDCESTRVPPDQDIEISFPETTLTDQDTLCDLRIEKVESVAKFPHSTLSDQDEVNFTIKDVKSITNLSQRTSSPLDDSRGKDVDSSTTNRLDSSRDVKIIQVIDAMKQLSGSTRQADQYLNNSTLAAKTHPGNPVSSPSSNSAQYNAYTESFLATKDAFTSNKSSHGSLFKAIEHHSADSDSDDLLVIDDLLDEEAQTSTMQPLSSTNPDCTTQKKQGHTHKDSLNCKEQQSNVKYTNRTTQEKQGHLTHKDPLSCKDQHPPQQSAPSPSTPIHEDKERSRDEVRHQYRSATIQGVETFLKTFQKKQSQSIQQHSAANIPQTHSTEDAKTTTSDIKLTNHRTFSANALKIREAPTNQTTTTLRDSSTTTINSRPLSIHRQHSRQPNSSKTLSTLSVPLTALEPNNPATMRKTHSTIDGNRSNSPELKKRKLTNKDVQYVQKEDVKSWIVTSQPKKHQITNPANTIQHLQTGRAEANHANVSELNTTQAANTDQVANTNANNVGSVQYLQKEDVMKWISPPQQEYLQKVDPEVFSLRHVSSQPQNKSPQIQPSDDNLNGRSQINHLDDTPPIMSFEANEDCNRHTLSPTLQTVQQSESQLIHCRPRSAPPVPVYKKADILFTPISKGRHKPYHQPTNNKHTFACNVCGKLFFGFRNLQQHKQKSHNFVKCELCYECFPNIKKLKTHTNNHFRKLPPNGGKLPPNGEKLPPNGGKLPPNGEKLPPNDGKLIASGRLTNLKERSTKSTDIQSVEMRVTKDHTQTSPDRDGDAFKEPENQPTKIQKSTENADPTQRNTARNSAKQEENPAQKIEDSSNENKVVVPNQSTDTDPTKNITQEREKSHGGGKLRPQSQGEGELRPKSQGEGELRPKGQGGKELLTDLFACNKCGKICCDLGVLKNHERTHRKKSFKHSHKLLTKHTESTPKESRTHPVLSGTVLPINQEPAPKPQTPQVDLHEIISAKNVPLKNLNPSQSVDNTHKRTKSNKMVSTNEKKRILVSSPPTTATPMTIHRQQEDNSNGNKNISTATSTNLHKDAVEIQKLFNEGPSNGTLAAVNDRHKSMARNDGDQIALFKQQLQHISEVAQLQQTLALNMAKTSNCKDISIARGFQESALDQSCRVKKLLLSSTKLEESFRKLDEKLRKLSKKPRKLSKKTRKLNKEYQALKDDFEAKLDSCRKEIEVLQNRSSLLQRQILVQHKRLHSSSFVPTSRNLEPKEDSIEVYFDHRNVEKLKMLQKQLSIDLDASIILQKTFKNMITQPIGYRTPRKDIQSLHNEARENEQQIRQLQPTANKLKSTLKGIQRYTQQGDVDNAQLTLVRKDYIKQFISFHKQADETQQRTKYLQRKVLLLHRERNRQQEVLRKCSTLAKESGVKVSRIPIAPNKQIAPLQKCITVDGEATLKVSQNLIALNEQNPPSIPALLHKHQTASNPNAQTDVSVTEDNTSTKESDSSSHQTLAAYNILLNLSCCVNAIPTSFDTSNATASPMLSSPAAYNTAMVSSTSVRSTATTSSNSQPITSSFSIKSESEGKLTCPPDNVKRSPPMLSDQV